MQYGLLRNTPQTTRNMTLILMQTLTIILFTFFRQLIFEDSFLERVFFRGTFSKGLFFILVTQYCTGGGTILFCFFTEHVSYINMCALQSLAVEGNHQCVICMKLKYRIIILIVIIISPGQILLSYMANTSHTHTHTRVHAHSRTQVRMHACTDTLQSPFRLSLFDGSVPPAINGRSLLHSNKLWRGRPSFPEVFGVFCV